VSGSAADKSNSFHTNNEPLDARQFKQWHMEQEVGNASLSIDTFMLPQLQEPGMIAKESMVLELVAESSTEIVFGIYSQTNSNS
jgi:hypothetical protein